MVESPRVGLLFQSAGGLGLHQDSTKNLIFYTALRPDFWDESTKIWDEMAREQHLSQGSCRIEIFRQSWGDKLFMLSSELAEVPRGAPMIEKEIDLAIASKLWTENQNGTWDELLGFRRERTARGR